MSSPRFVKDDLTVAAGGQSGPAHGMARRQHSRPGGSSLARPVFGIPQLLKPGSR
jgi:hypothetical protein